MKHAVRAGGCGAQAVQVLERSAMRLGAEGGEGLSAGIGSGETEHLMAVRDQVFNDGRTDEAGRAGNEHTHRKSFRGVWEDKSRRDRYPGKVVTLSGYKEH